MSRPLGATTVTILAVVQQRVCYGVDLIRRTGLMAGTVYTTLRRLERRGLIQGKWEDAELAASERRPRRRYYSITKDGEAALDEATARLGELGFTLARPLPSAGDSE